MRLEVVFYCNNCGAKSDPHEIYSTRISIETFSNLPSEYQVVQLSKLHSNDIWKPSMEVSSRAFYHSHVVFCSDSCEQSWLEALNKGLVTDLHIMGYSKMENKNEE